MDNFDMAALTIPLAAGATLHTADAMEGDYAVLVWSDGSAQPADVRAALALSDCDFLEVVRSERDGLETRLNDAGRRWLAEWQATLAAVEVAAWELYEVECRGVLGLGEFEKPASGWLVAGVYYALRDTGMDPQRVAEYIEAKKERVTK